MGDDTTLTLATKLLAAFPVCEFSGGTTQSKAASLSPGLSASFVNSTHVLSSCLKNNSHKTHAILGVHYTVRDLAYD